MHVMNNKYTLYFIGEEPSVRDVGNACMKLGLQCLVEVVNYFILLIIQNKRYPKRWWVPGRCRIRIHNADGSPCNTLVNSRIKLMYIIMNR